MEALHRLAVVAALAVGCSDSNGNGTGPCGSGGTASAVNVCDNFFAPASSPVGSGAAVAWTWRGGNAHNVTFEDGQGSSTTQTSGTHGRTFPAAGTFRYRCTIHSSGFDGSSGQMVGTVTVHDAVSAVGRYVERAERPTKISAAHGSRHRYPILPVSAVDYRLTSRSDNMAVRDPVALERNTAGRPSGFTPGT